MLDIEYATSKERQTLVRTHAAKHGLVQLLTDRELKTLGESEK